MAAAIALLQGFGQKVAPPKEQHEHRILQVNMSSPAPVDIEFSNITLKVPAGLMSKKTKTILKEVSGRFKSGELTAIMGPSGAGKSSLLNALTGFCTNGVTGTIRAGDSICELRNRNDGFRSLKTYRKKSCYILQDDRLNPLFTVSELMHFAADMKIGNGLNDKLKQTVISDVLNTLGLSGTEDTLCSKLSGGQRKRVSIAAELIDNPPVIFLDEPTTGLDSLSSAQCIEMLKELAYGQRTVICTIHQPSASIYSMFDQVYILAEGMCIYNGSSENTVPHLATVGFHCPMYHNPADYILEIANGEYGNFNEMLAKNLPAILSRQDLEKCRQSIVQVPSRGSVDTFSCGKMSVLVKPPHEFYKFNVLLKRCFVQQYRDWTVTHLKLILHVFVGVLLGLLYHKAGEDGARTINNMGFLMVSAVYLCYTSLMPSVLKFPSELPVLKKENFNNWYNLKTYYAAVLVTGIPIQIWFSFVYSLSSYFLSGQPPDLIRFGMFVLALANVTVLSDAIGNIFGTCFNPVNGTFLGAIFVCAMIAFAGFLALISDMHAVMQVVSCVSFVKYGFEAAALAVYADERPPLLCPDTKPYCHLRYPKEIIKQFSFHYDGYWNNILILVIEVIVFRIIAYFTLRRTVKRSS